MNPNRIGTLAGACALSLAALAGCTLSSSRDIAVDSEQALEESGQLFWLKPDGTRAARGEVFTIRDACTDDIKRSSTDPIQKVPRALVSDCMVGKGWRQVRR